MAEPTVVERPQEILESTTNLPPRTDAGNAELVCMLYRAQLRFIAEQGVWLIWSKKRHRWERDTHDAILHYAIKAARYRRLMARSINDDLEDVKKAETKSALGSESLYKLKAAITIAGTLPPIRDKANNWDADPFFLGVDNGILDLRDGRSRQGTEADRVSQFSPVQFDPHATCPLFEAFLRKIFFDDTELIEYIGEAIGYSLTGKIKDHALFICHGDGSNGKTTLFSIIQYILGEYTHVLPSSTFDRKNASSLTPEREKLKGCRFALVNEIKEDMIANEESTKALTGGDFIHCRPLHRAPYSFSPTHKLWFAVNHMPYVRDITHGYWRRIHVIPFNYKFSEQEADLDFLEKLKSEAPGILAWAVRGCLRWQEKGRLKQPAIVKQSVESYREESDVLGRFIQECGKVGPDEQMPNAEGYTKFRLWAGHNGEPMLSQKAFSQRMKDRKFREERKSTGRVWHGISLLFPMIYMDSNA